MKGGENIMRNGANISFKQLRKTNKLSQQEIAEITGISVFTIQKIEQGKVTPSLNNVVKLKDVFHCNYEVIINALLTTQNTLQ